MFKYFDLKLCRKFLILAVLTGAIFMAGSTSNASSGDFCCSVCDEPYWACIADCQLLFPGSPEKQWSCIQQFCWPDFYWCMQQGVCDPGC